MENMDDKLDSKAKQEDQDALTSTLAAFLTYSQYTEKNVVKPMEDEYAMLPKKYNKALDPVAMSQRLYRCNTAIFENAIFLNAVVNAGANDFLAPQDMSTWRKPSALDASKVQSTLKQLVRDWADEGSKERDACYGPFIRELNARYPDVKERRNIRVLVPGCGLGRLPFDLAVNGYCSQGNEFSYHMLIMSSFILNRFEQEKGISIIPYVHETSNQRSLDNQLRTIYVPDVVPSKALELARKQTPATEEPSFSMIAGSFPEVYMSSSEKGKWNCVATCFFIDTAPNILTYLETIHNCLASDGIWINLGPLQWHHKYESNDKRDGNESDDDESYFTGLSLDELKDVIENMGFEFVKPEASDIPNEISTTYAGDSLSLVEWIYHAHFWICKKRIT